MSVSVFTPTAARIYLARHCWGLRCFCSDSFLNLLESLENGRIIFPVEIVAPHPIQQVLSGQDLLYVNGRKFHVSKILLGVLEPFLC